MKDANIDTQYQSSILQDAYSEGFKDGSKSLRDHFAGLAMQAIISNDDAMKYVNMVLKGMSAERGVSILSYRYADEMLEARNAK